MTTPTGLRAGGEALWRAVTAIHDDLDDTQLVTLEAACRQRDRTDQLATAAATGDAGALRHERDAALAMVRLLSALRLPNAAGRRAQLRSIRGVHQSPVKPSSLERAAARSSVKERLRSQDAEDTGI